MAKTRAGITDLHIIMGEVHALVEMTVPSDEMGDITMTPAILDQVTPFRTRTANALDLPRMPTIPPALR